MCAIELIEKLCARVHDPVLDGVLPTSAKQNGTSPAVAFCADDLRAGFGDRISEIIRQRLEDLRAPNFVALAVDVQEEKVTHGIGNDRSEPSKNTSQTRAR